MKLDNVEDVYVLAPTQLGMLFHDIAAPSSGVYVNQLICTLEASLDASILEKAWQLVVNQHPTLRTAFLWDGVDEPLQVVRASVGLTLGQEDWRDLSPVEREKRWTKALAADRTQGFDLDQAPLLRTRLLRISDQRYRFIWSSHHLILDGWSAPQVLKEVDSLYASLSRGQDHRLKPRRPYRDYIACLQQQDLSQAESFWKNQLQGFTQVTALQIDQTLKPFTERAVGYQQRQTTLSETATLALQSLARRHRLTLNTLIQGAWSLLLNRYSGNRDIVYGTTFSGRPPDLRGVEDMIVVFINTLPLRVEVANQQLLDWLREIQNQQLNARQYEHTPLVKVQGWSDLPRGQALFDNILVFENYPSQLPGTQPSELGVRDVQYLEQSNYPLALLVVPGNSLRLYVIYDGDRFQEDAILRLLSHLGTLLEDIAANPERRLSSFSILSEAERQLLTTGWNETESPFPREVCVHDLFESQANKTPDGIAVEYEDQQLTYGELDKYSNQLADHLIRLGVGPETHVALCLERSMEMVVAVLGTLKAGAAYVPIDPALPGDRVSYILADTQSALLLTRRQLAGRLPDNQVEVCYLDLDEAPFSDRATSKPESNASALQAAYTIYTSGSTGQPKGVVVSHQNLVQSTQARLDYYSESIRAFLLLSSYAVDSSMAGIFWTLLSGGTLVLPRQGLELDTRALAALISSHNVSHLLCLPSLYSLLLEDSNPDELDPLNTVVVAGEACPNDLVKLHHDSLTDTALFNEYGPSEATVWCTVCEIPSDLQGQSVPIGRPVANSRIYLLGPNLEPVPIGVPGQIYVGGAGVARGYLKQPGLTSERFLPDPFSRQPGARLYRTGDLAYLIPDGNLNFIGRLDLQVKIRGHRVEPGEVERVLRTHSGVRDVVVVASSEDNRLDLDGYREADQKLTDRLSQGLLTLGPEIANDLLDEIENLAEDEVAGLLAKETTPSRA